MLMLMMLLLQTEELNENNNTNNNSSSTTSTKVEVDRGRFNITHFSHRIPYEKKFLYDISIRLCLLIETMFSCNVFHTMWHVFAYADAATMYGMCVSVCVSEI